MYVKIGKVSLKFMYNFNSLSIKITDFILLQHTEYYKILKTMLMPICSLLTGITYFVTVWKKHVIPYCQI